MIKINLNNIYFNKLTDLNVIEERFKYDFKLWQITKFNKLNSFSLQECLKLICHLSFKDVKFDKKQMIICLFLLELLTSQKSCLIQSKNNNMFLKIRKGSPVSCKVTLRGSKMYEMFDSLNLAFTRISPQSFIKISKQIQNKGGRFFSYQLDSLERFVHLSNLTVGEHPKKIDFCWVFNNTIWQETIFYLSSLKFPMQVNFKYKWQNQKKFFKANFIILDSNKKTNFIKNETLFHLNKLFFILNLENPILVINKSDHYSFNINFEKKPQLYDNIIKEIKIPNKYLRLLNNFNNFPLKKQNFSGDIIFIVLKKNLTIQDFTKIINFNLESKKYLLLGFFYKKEFFNMNFFRKKLDIFLKNNINEKFLIYRFILLIHQKLLFSLSFKK